MQISYDAKKLAKVARQFKLVLISQFGSTVDGSVMTHPESDLDIAILNNAGKIADKFLQLQYEIGQAFASDKGMITIDLVDLASANSLLAYRIATHGKVLYDQDGHQFNQFYISAIKRFIDEQPLYDFEANRLAKKVKEYAR